MTNTTPRVKALEWRDQRGDGSLVAVSTFGIPYLASPRGWGFRNYPDYNLVEGGIEAAKAAAQADYEARIIAALEPQEAEPTDHEIFDWLETELSAIGIWYRGDPSYEHDAYWFRDRVRELFKRGRGIFPSAPVPASEKAAGVTDAMVEAAEAAVYKRHERGFLIKPLVDPIDMRAALEAALSASHPVQGWQTMDSAPKDGTEVLLFGHGIQEAEGRRSIHPRARHIGFFCDGEWLTKNLDIVCQAEVWSPLPAGPSSKETAA